jgi:hypothetical protein
MKFARRSAAVQSHDGGIAIADGLNIRMDGRCALHAKSDARLRAGLSRAAHKINRSCADRRGASAAFYRCHLPRKCRVGLTRQTPRNTTLQGSGQN